MYYHVTLEQENIIKANEGVVRCGAVPVKSKDASLYQQL